jgi:hypothetical protein
MDRVLEAEALEVEVLAVEALAVEALEAGVVGVRAAEAVALMRVVEALKAARSAYRLEGPRSPPCS